jgi:hypothetical protein
MRWVGYVARLNERRGKEHMGFWEEKVQDIDHLQNLGESRISGY